MNFTEFQNDLSSYEPERIVIVGLGNPQRGDDAAGLVLLVGIGKSSLSGALLVSAGTTPENSLQQILSADPALVVFLDACRFRGSPGEIRWLDADEIEDAGISTHAYSITVIEKFLNLEKPVECRYLGIQPGTRENGVGLSEEVREGIKAFFQQEG